VHLGLRQVGRFSRIQLNDADPDVRTADIGEEAPSITTRAVESEIGERTKHAIEAACKALIDAEGELTEMDRITGDGDLGTSMARAARAVQNAVNSYPLDDAPDTLKALGHTLQRELGGSSGPLYGVLFLRCGSVLKNVGEVGLAQWADALDQGCRAISELGGANGRRAGRELGGVGV